MSYSKKAYLLDKPHIVAAQKENAQLSFTYLFDKYYPITLYHLIKEFNKVRTPVLEDSAIEVVEDWLLNINTYDWDEKSIGAMLCHRAKMKVFKILRPKHTQTPISHLDNDDSNFLDVLVYKELASVNYNEDLAKLTFQLKTKIDQYIPELSERDYNIITTYLDGGNMNDIARSCGLNEKHSWRNVQVAFSNLKKIISGSRNVIFDKQKIMYMNCKAVFKHPDVMNLYYKEGLTIKQISERTGESYNAIKSKINRDRMLMKKTA